MERGGAPAGMGRGAASRIAAAAGGSGAGVGRRLYDPNRYNIAGWAGPVSGSASGGALNNAGDILWSVPVRFDVPGQITAIGTFLGNPTSGSGESWIAMYTGDVTNVMQPLALIHSFQCDGKGFNQGYEETGLAIDVAAGDLIHFASAGTASPRVDVYNGGAVSIGTVQIETPVGVTYNPSDNSGSFAAVVAVKKALTYAWPPPDPFPTLAAGTTDLVLTSFSGGIVTFLFKFSPT